MKLKILIPLFIACFTTISLAGSTPVKQYPGNKHYLSFRGEPVLLMTLGEHYASVIDLDFDYVAYLNSLQQNGFNLTRTFAYWRSEYPEKSHLGVNGTKQYCAPWTYSSVKGGYDGQKFDLANWNPEYFSRLKNFLIEADKRDIVVELVLFSNIYRERTWETHPFNAVNNVNDIANLKNRREFHTLRNVDLLNEQRKYVAKLVKELEGFDNVYFEICNEPPTQEQMQKSGMEINELWDWHNEMIRTIQDTESTLTPSERHSIAINPMHGNKDNWLQYIDLNSVNIINRHYNNAMSGVWSGDYAMDKVCAFDEGAYVDVPYPEQHHHPTNPEQQRVEAWMYMCSGGGIYNGLAKHSYSVADPAGNTPNALLVKKYLGVCKSFMEEQDFVNMSQNKDIVVSGVPEGAKWRALSEDRKKFLIYLCHVKSEHGAYYSLVEGDYRPTLTLLLNASESDRYLAEWIDTKTGHIIKTKEFRHLAEGTRKLKSPKYKTDILLSITAMKRDR